ncbi:ABC transporter ATP-binding protein [Oceanirhabdus sp. W0125-5]|uniref:ABC transporter ATP-binding protein n=1 Tax=Oceanirhabdus sp. W0125-5 TaxID=2999116 RepID=UPI0022F2C107|nr:ABC transporter ATP-binding protein [Oceanirhabdus sp. W0125-5]WBW97822.1 ABC transporter ATP-binding protein [Oceanirhabdus sp. W0125-5]
MESEKKINLMRDVKIVFHFLKLASGISKSYIPLLMMSAIFKAILPLINIIIPKFIIDELMGNKNIDVFIKLVLVIVIANGVLGVINAWLDTKIDIKRLEINNGFDLLLGKKIMDMDFENIEDPKVLDLKEKAIFPIKNQGAINRLINGFVNLFTQIVTIIGLMAVIFTLNGLIVAMILGVVILNIKLYQKSQKTQFKFYKELIPINRKFMYYGSLTSDFSYGKDIRLYGIHSMIMNKIKDYNKESIGGFSKVFLIMGKYQGLNEINLAIQMTLVYGYMVFKVIKGAIGIGSFTMYINAANKFSTSISEFFKVFVEVQQMCRYLENYVEFEQIGSTKKQGRISVDGVEKCEIEFKNVYFKYPRSENYTLKNVSIKINQGEKLSIVGLNGAGKTTFIKLLTRLYEPTEGEILLNGTNIKDYDYNEYIKLLSVVFQDFKLMAFTVKENIALQYHDKYEDKEIMKVIEKSGLKQDILKLPKGIKTSVYKTFEKDGIEFSGGQSQKIAISRAIHKDAPIVVLDEPTAALDPIAEYEIYNRFNQLIGNKTTIYISHRLSSCKFCDRVAVFHKGTIIQHGHHDELIAEKESQYEQMYSAQAQYYVS